MKKTYGFKSIFSAVTGLCLLVTQAHASNESLDILRQGLLGAGVGAISSGVSGGKAGRGALIGAGTQVLGTALLGILSGDSRSQSQSYSYTPTPASYSYTPYVQPQPVIQTQPVQIQQPVYTTVYRVDPVQTQTVYVQQAAPVYRVSPPAQDGSRMILRQGLLGAGVGAISAYTSGGKAGQGALVGAGSNVIGGALLDWLSTSS